MKWLDGKKRTLAHIYWVVLVPALLIIYPDGTPEVISKTSTIIGLVLSSVGYGHASYKKSEAENAKKR